MYARAHKVTNGTGDVRYVPCIIRIIESNPEHWHRWVDHVWHRGEPAVRGALRTYRSATRAQRIAARVVRKQCKQWRLD